MSTSRTEATPDLLRAIKEASATGNLQEVKALFQRWSTTRATSLELGESIPPEVDEHLEMALSEAAKNGHAAVVSYLLDQGIKITNSVMTGVKEGKSESVFQALLDHGWDINSKWWLDITTLCVITADENLVKWHLRNGADPNIASWRGFTALEYATYNGSLGTVKALVEHGDVLANTTALIGAASGQPREDRLAIMSFLLDRGVDIDQLERGQDPRSNPVYAGVAAGTALHRAVESGDPECLQFLLGRGADRRVKGLNGHTPLGLAEELGLEEMAGILRAE